MRADHKKGQLSELEIQADRVIRDIRAAEAASIWNREYEGIPHPFPGMEFLTGIKIHAEKNANDVDGSEQVGVSLCRQSYLKYWERQVFSD